MKLSLANALWTFYFISLAVSLNQILIKQLPNGSLPVIATTIRNSLKTVALQKTNSFDVALYKINPMVQIFSITTNMNKRISALEFSLDGNTLAIGSQDFTLQIWNVTTDIPVQIRKHIFEARVNSFNFKSNSCEQYVIGLNDGTIFWSITANITKQLKSQVKYLLQVQHSEFDNRIIAINRTKQYYFTYNATNDTIQIEQILSTSNEDNQYIQSATISGQQILGLNLLINSAGQVQITVKDKSSDTFLKNYRIQSRNQWVNSMNAMSIQSSQDKIYLILAGMPNIEVIQIRENVGNLTQPVIILQIAYFQTASSSQILHARFFPKKQPLIQIEYALIVNGVAYYKTQVIQDKSIQCLQGQYFRADFSICEICPFGCKSCSSPTFCINCKYGFKFNAANFTCQKCNQNGCSKCSTNLNVCTQCFRNYRQFSIGGSTSCVNCHNLIPLCVKCYRNSIIAQVQCQLCPSGFYMNAVGFCLTCSSKIPNCLACISQTQCVKCTAGYYVQFGIGNSCELCSHECTQCQFSLANCTSCSQNYRFNPLMNSCRCYPPFIQNVQNFKCILCNISSCLQCSIENYCQICSENRTVITLAEVTEYKRQGTCSVYCDIQNCVYCSFDNICQLCEAKHHILNKECQLIYFDFQDKKLRCLMQMIVVQRSNTLKFSLKFSQPYKLMDSIQNIFQFNLNNASQVPYTVEQHNNSGIQSQQIIFSIVYNQTYHQLTVVVQIQKYKVKHFSQSYYLYDQNFTFKQRQVMHFDNQQKSQIESISSISLASYKTSQYAFFLLLITGTLSLILNLVVMFQILPLYLFLAVKIPTNLRTFLEQCLGIQVQGMIPFDLPDFLTQFTQPQQLPYEYTQYGLSNNIISQNKQDILILFVYWIITLILGLIAKNCLPNGKIRGYLFQRFYRQRYDQCLAQLQGTYLVFIFSASLIMFKTERIQTQGHLINLVIAYFVFSICFISILVHFFIVQERKKNQDELTIIQQSLQGYKYKNPQSIYILTYQNFMQCCISGLLVVLHPVSILLLMAVSILKLINLFYKNPKIFDAKVFLVLRILSALAFFFYNVLFFFFWINSSPDMNFIEDNTFWILGYVGLGLISVIIGAGIVQVLINASFAIYGLLKKNKVKTYHQQLREIKEAKTMKTLNKQNKNQNNSRAKVNSTKKIRVHYDLKAKNDHSQKIIQLNSMKNNKKEVRIVNPKYQSRSHIQQQHIQVVKQSKNNTSQKDKKSIIKSHRQKINAIISFNQQQNDRQIQQSKNKQNLQSDKLESRRKKRFRTLYHQNELQKQNKMQTEFSDIIKTQKRFGSSKKSQKKQKDIKRQQDQQLNNDIIKFE